MPREDEPDGVARGIAFDGSYFEASGKAHFGNYGNFTTFPTPFAPKNSRSRLNFAAEQEKVTARLTAGTRVQR